MLTDVPAVMRGYGTPNAEAIHAIGVDELAAMPFPAGSMGPKIEATVRFVRASGRSAAIGDLGDAVAVLTGRRGTAITPSSNGPVQDAPAPADPPGG
ncbi:MAG TPA: hypothetical protein VES42_07285 [Pilimelia sp.]|nr:hypothetical protein [Pilimelia sp.]